MKIIALPLVLLGLLVPLVHADQTRTSEKPETWLFVRTTPAGAQVSLDGRQLGTSTDLFPVESGAYKLVVKLEGHDPQTQTVTIRAGEVTRVVLKLTKRPKPGRSGADPKRPGPDSASADDKDAVAAIRKLGAVLEARSDGTVRSLNFKGTQVANADLALLRKLARPDDLDLSGTQISDAGLAHLAKLTGLETLDLSGTRITDAGLVHLRPLATLVTSSRPSGKLSLLSLAQTKITDAGLVHLKDFVSLRSLWFADTKVTDAGLKWLKNLTSLRELDLSRVQITDAGLAHLKGLTKLELLELDGTRVTDAGLPHLKGLTKLKKLRLQRTQVTDRGATELLKGLPELDDYSGPGLTSRKPGEPADTGTGVEDSSEAAKPSEGAGPRPPKPQDEEAVVERLKKLGAEVDFTRSGTVKSVSFKGTGLTDAKLESLIDSLKRLSDLEELDFSGTQITDAALVHLERLAHLRLETLDLSGTRVSDEGIRHLNSHLNLHRLNLQDTRVTAHGTSELFLPGLYMFGYKGPKPPTVAPRKILLVEADGAGEKAVLDLASGETLPLTDKAVRDPSVFTRMGKGDFWYGNNRIVCLRGAKAVYIESFDGFLEEKPYRGHADVTVYKLPDAPRVDRGRRLWITTAEKKHFLVKIVSVTREDDAVLEYQPADNPFRTKWDPTFRKGLAGVAAIDLDTGRTLASAPFPVEDWPDAFELVWKPGDRAVLRKHGSPARVIQLRDVKNFEEASDQALRRFKELEESGEHDRSGAVSSLDGPGMGPWDARYFAVITNRECLAVIELIPPPTKEQRRTLRDILTEGWIKWSLGYVEHFRRDLPPLVTPVRRLPSDIPRRR